MPRSWGGTDTSPPTVGPKNNLLPRCPTAHRNFHALLNLYVHHGGPPPWPGGEDLRRFSQETRRWVDVAWSHRIPGHPTPYTLKAPDAG